MDAAYVQVIISAEEAGTNVKTVLRQRFGLSTNLLRRLKQTSGGILLDGAPVTVRAQVQPGQVLAVLKQPDSGKESRVAAQTGALDIIFEDQDLLILNKPAGLPVHPSPGHDGNTLANYVMGYYQSRGLDLLFHPINRLDRGTSGLICIAKTQIAAQRLGIALQKRQIKRTYQAVVAGGPGMPAAGTVNLPIGRKPGVGIAREVRADGEPAGTHFRVLERRAHAILLELRLETGRTHQIRVHCSYLGHPVLGDFMYGEEYDWLDGQALHACRLAFTHPITGADLCFEAPAPWYFAALLEGKHPMQPPVAEK